MDDKRGVEKSDLGALTEEQQSKLNSFKVREDIIRYTFLT